MCLSSLVGLGLVRKEENVIVIFRYHFLLKESMPLAFKNRLHQKCYVPSWLKIGRWLWRRSQPCEKCIDIIVDNRTNAGR